MCYIPAYKACYISRDVLSLPGGIHKQQNSDSDTVLGSPLYGKAPVSDPSDALIEVHLADLKWNMQQRRFGLVAEDCKKLQRM